MPITQRTVIDVVPVITAGAYSLGDALGGLLTFPGASRGPGHGGVIESLRVVDRAQQKKPLDLFLFDQSVTVVADNAVFAISDADWDHWIGTIPLVAANYFDGVDNSGAVVSPVGLPFVTVGANLYGQLVVRGSVAPTYVAATDIRVRLMVRWD
jgi:hypothetical protein